MAIRYRLDGGVTVDVRLMLRVFADAFAARVLPLIAPT